LYRTYVIFKQVNPSPAMVRPKEDMKKLVVQLPPNFEQVELKNEQEVHGGLDEEDGIESS